MEGNCACQLAENENGLHFSTTGAAFFFFKKKKKLQPGVICVTFYDWSAAHSLTNHCNCRRKNCCLLSRAWKGVERTIWTNEADFAWWFQLQFVKEVGNSCNRRIGEWGRGGVSGERWLGGQRCFVGHFSNGPASLKKFQTSWLAKRCLLLLFRRSASLYRSTVYVYTINMLVVYVYFRNPLNYDVDYRIFNMPTWSLNTWVHVFCLPLFIP